MAKDDLVRPVSERTSQDTVLVGEIVDATLEEIYEVLKRGESVSLRNFGTFSSASNATRGSSN